MAIAIKHAKLETLFNTVMCNIHKVSCSSITIYGEHKPLSSKEFNAQQRAYSALMATLKTHDRVVKIYSNSKSYERLNTTTYDYYLKQQKTDFENTSDVETRYNGSSKAELDEVTVSGIIMASARRNSTRW